MTAVAVFVQTKLGVPGLRGAMVGWRGSYCWFRVADPDVLCEVFRVGRGGITDSRRIVEGESIMVR